MLRGKTGQLGSAAGGMRSVGRQHTALPAVQLPPPSSPIPAHVSQDLVDILVLLRSVQSISQICSALCTSNTVTSLSNFIKKFLKICLQHPIIRHN